MADIDLVLNEQNSLSQTVESFYTAPSNANSAGVKIKVFSAANNSTTSNWYKAYIYLATGPDPQAVVPLTIVVRDRKHHGESIVGLVIPAGGSLRMETSTAGGLNFCVAGQELTT